MMNIARQAGAIDAWRSSGDGGRAIVKFLVTMEGSQTLIDAIQSAAVIDDTCRIVIPPALATIPDQEADRGRQEQEEKAKTAPLEELYNSVAQGATVDSTFVLLTFLSTLVAAIGLFRDNVAVILGAMVIAPLLGPNLAFAFGVALGDRKLMFRAARANLLGLAWLGLAWLGLAWLGLAWLGSRHCRFGFRRPDSAARTVEPRALGANHRRL